MKRRRPKTDDEDRNDAKSLKSLLDKYVPQSESDLRKFADTAGLPGDSLFDNKSMEGKLPHPSTWNHFARNVSQPEGGQGGTHGCH